MQNFESIESYLTHARRMICKFGGRHSKKLLSDEDCVGEVAGSIMRADWNYKEDHIKNKKACSPSTLRCVYAKNAIFSIIEDWAKRGRIKTSPINDFIPGDNAQNPSFIVEQKDYISYLMDNSGLTAKQAGCVERYYFDNMTLKETGNYYGFSYEAARKHIESAQKKMRKEVGNYCE
jgi:DNA-directed RNA polymerase specialized sigma24 family protein